MTPTDSGTDGVACDVTAFVSDVYGTESKDPIRATNMYSYDDYARGNDET